MGRMHLSTNPPLLEAFKTVRMSRSTHTAIASAMMRAGSISLAAAALALAATVGAQAQTVAPTQTQAVADQAVGAVLTDQAATPAPKASPAGQTNPQGGPPPGAPNPTGGQPSVPQRPPATAPRPAPRPAPFSPFIPVLDFVVTFTQPANYNSKPAVQAATVTGGVNQLSAYDPVDLGGTVRIPITRKLNLLFDRITEGTLNQPLERSFLGPSPGTVVNYPRDSRDVILQYHATYAFDRFLTMDVGNSFRHRIWAFGNGPGGSTLATISAQPFPYTLASQEHHFSYLGFTYVTKPWKEFLRSSFALSLTGDVQNVDHHVAVLCSAANIAANVNQCGGRLVNQVGYLDENPGKDKYYETTQGVTWIVPVDPRHGTTFTLNERWGYLNFYENTPQPYRWTSALTYQLSKRFSPGFTMALRHSNFFQSNTQSTPFTAPNGIHVGSWDVIGTFHYDFNQMFH
jgi:hypothetical protein